MCGAVSPAANPAEIMEPVDVLLFVEVGVAEVETEADVPSAHPPAETDRVADVHHLTVGREPELHLKQLGERLGHMQ